LKTLEMLAALVAHDCLEMGLLKVSVVIEKSHALLHADTAGISITRSQEDILFLKACLKGEREWTTNPLTEDTIFIKNLALSCIIGINPHERCEKQRVIINIVMHFVPSLCHPKIAVPEKNNYKTVARKVSQFVEESDYQTIEALAIDVCNVVLYQCHVDKVTCRIEKPSALMFAASSGVEICRSKSVNSTQSIPLPSSSAQTCYLAIGTNLGDRVASINDALRHLDDRKIKITDTSFLYETSPMYVEDQPKFLNGALKEGFAF
jgi:dihydroneopterin aldolase/2-amino-4-hydroxy-6-hydroxymethyldihydropteridine diphosphokinase/dihydropteroate synthase